MAVSKTDIDVSGLRKTWDVTATADGDTTLSIAHGFTCLGADNTAKDAYAKARIVPILTILSAAGGLSQWSCTVDRTNIVLTKGTGVGSGDSSAQLRVTGWFVHSMVE